MKKKIILIFMVFLGLSWYLAVSEIVVNPKKAAACVKRAEELEKKGIYVDAIAEYEEALTYCPGDLSVTLKMADAYLQTGSGKKFVSLCKEMAGNFPENGEAIERLVKYYVEKKDESSAVKYLKEYVEQYPNSQTAKNWLVKLKGSYEKLFCDYEELSPICNDSMVVKKEGRYGIVDALGQEILAPEFEEAHPFSKDGLALVRRDGKYSYVDRDGQTRLVPDAAYTQLGLLENDRTTAAKKGKYGYLDKKLTPVSEFVWDDLTLIQDGVGAGKKNGVWSLVSRKGEPLSETAYEAVAIDDSGACFGQKRIFVKEKGKFHLIDKKGTSIGELQFDDARCFQEEGYAAVCQNGLWGYVNAKGELVLKCQYEDAASFSNGFAAVCQDGLWGYIDEEGNLVVSPQFTDATSVSEKGTAAVKGDEWMLIQFDLFQ